MLAKWRKPARADASVSERRTCSAGFHSDRVRGLDGWNTFDTDNNETRAGQQTQETACFFCCWRFKAVTRWAVVPPQLRRVLPWDAVAVFVKSVKSVGSVSQTHRALFGEQPLGRPRGVWSTDSTDGTNSTDTSNCIHGGNTARRIELEPRTTKETAAS